MSLKEGMAPETHGYVECQKGTYRLPIPGEIVLSFLLQFIDFQYFYSAWIVTVIAALA